MKKISYLYERDDHRGTFREYVNSDRKWKSVNYGTMRKNAIMGNHYHKKNKAIFFILSGSAEFLIKNILKNGGVRKMILKEGEGVEIDRFETHTIKFLEKSSFLLLKSEKFSERDKDLYEAKLL